VALVAEKSENAEGNENILAKLSTEGENTSS
jgi:hypothetical protein